MKHARVKRLLASVLIVTGLGLMIVSALDGKPIQSFVGVVHFAVGVYYWPRPPTRGATVSVAEAEA